MATDIKVPTLGESVTSATVARWMKQEGEAVAAGAEAMKTAIPSVREILTRRQQHLHSAKNLPSSPGRGLSL